MSALTVYGITSCDTCRKALKWLDEHGREYRWHDLRVDGLEREAIERWLTAVGADELVNRRSTTWRGLDESARAAAADTDGAIDLMLDHPTLIKRPLFVAEGQVLVGFNAAVRDKL